MKIDNVKVYGFFESVKASGLPMSVDGDPEFNDNRIKRLSKTPIGSGHDQALVGIVVQFDATGSNKWWTEMQRYHFVDFVSSQSTMHCLSKFNLDTLYNEYVDPRVVSIMKEYQLQYNANPTLDNLYKLLYNNPAGCQLKARLTTNYRQLKTIYNQRKDHRLQEWKDFCLWIVSLPESHLITGQVES